VDNASVVKDMDLPGYRLDELKGSEAGEWAVWVNGNWRMTFRFEGTDAMLVNYQDYH
jgi:toxin HigB-1